jgi:TonB-dependent SusC/RagA subfamily outer membrane receptor
MRRSLPPLAAVALILSACGGPGLPPAGPAPGAVDVGYGTQDEDKVTGAATSISESELGELRGGSFEELLRGRAAGLQIAKRPDGSYMFRIRGLANDSDPLFVVDGVQVSVDRLEGALAGLTRNDIRQVEVLKDLASTSIYGTRGVGGVIIINTKR